MNCRLCRVAIKFEGYPGIWRDWVKLKTLVLDSGEILAQNYSSFMNGD